MTMEERIRAHHPDATNEPIPVTVENPSPTDGPMPSGYDEFGNELPPYLPYADMNPNRPRARNAREHEYPVIDVDAMCDALLSSPAVTRIRP